MTETLLHSLIVAPSPLPQFKYIYRNLESRIFADKNLVAEFLRTKESSESVELVKELVNRLCFESNYPPPYYLLLNNIDTEDSDINKATGGSYTPQDHFSHSLNLYLLVIYVYFYHPTFNKALTSFFSNKRDEPTHNRLLQSTKDFVSSWKYFCLYDDISYPIEILYKVLNNNGTESFPTVNKDQFNNYLNCFNDFSSLLCRDYVSKAISKLFITKKLLADDQNKTIKDIFTNLNYSFVKLGSNELISPDEVIEEYEGYIGIDKIYTYDHVKMLLDFVPNNEMITVLIDASSDNPVGFFRTGNNGEKELFSSNRAHGLSKDRLREMLLNDDIVSNRGYRLMYLFNNLSSLQSRVLNQCNIDIGHLDSACNLLFKLEEMRQDKYSFSRIEDAQIFGKYLFNCYKMIRDKFRELFSSCEDYLEVSNVTIKNGKRIYERYMKNTLSETITRNFSRILSKKLSKVSEETTEFSSDDKVEIEKELLKKLRKHINADVVDSILKEVATGASNDIVNIIKSEIKETNSLARIFYKVIKLLGFQVCKGATHLFEDRAEYELLVETCKSNSTIAQIYENINNRFLTEHGVSVDSLFSYRSKATRYDHGVFSFLYYLYCNSISFDIIQNSQNQCKIKYLVWDTNQQKIQTKLISNYKFVVEQTAYAILCHNIYSDVFKSKYSRDWMIRINSSPFVYFCCLMDSLQLWNRQKYYKHTTHLWNPAFSYSDYDIFINDDQLTIKFLTRIKKFEDLKRRQIDGMNSYLEHCTDYISIIMAPQ
jgi:hypothetical protein